MLRRVVVVLAAASVVTALARRFGVDLLTRTTGTWIGAPDR